MLYFWGVYVTGQSTCKCSSNLHILTRIFVITLHSKKKDFYLHRTGDKWEVPWTWISCIYYLNIYFGASLVGMNRIPWHFPSSDCCQLNYRADGQNTSRFACTCFWEKQQQPTFLFLFGVNAESRGIHESFANKAQLGSEEVALSTWTVFTTQLRLRQDIGLKLWITDRCVNAVGIKILIYYWSLALVSGYTRVWSIHPNISSVLLHFCHKHNIIHTDVITH